MSQSMIHAATQRAREDLADGVSESELLSIIGRLFPWLDPRQIVYLAGGNVEGWDARKGTLRRRAGGQ